MENLDMEWVEELRRQLPNHMLYGPLEDLRIQLEPDYKRAMAALPPEHRQDIERYFHVRQKLDVQLTHMAYSLGLQAGERRAKRAANPFPQPPSAASSEEKMNAIIRETALRARSDLRYDLCLANAKKMEPQYLALCRTLTAQQQKLIKDYENTIKDMYERMIITAYDMAKKSDD